MSRRLRAFKRWMHSQGIEYSNALEFVDNDEGISVKALCDLKEGDLVATIPKHACLTTQTTSAREIIEKAGLAGHLGLSVALMYERSLGHNSIWDGYLPLLPDRESVPLVWTLDEVDQFLTGTELHKIVKEDKRLLYEDWKECIMPLITSGLNPKSFGVEQYFAAKSLVASRSFEIDDYHGFGMVPLADLFNHKTGAENVHFTSVSSHSGSDNDDDNDHDDVNDEEYENARDDKPSKEDVGADPTALEMIIVKDVKAGTEVFNTYGSMGNAALLHRYGFTETDNPFSIVNIELSLVLQWSSSSYSSRYGRARLSLWRKLGWSGCMSQNNEYFEISSDGEPQLELLVLLYIFCLPEEAYQKLSLVVFSVGNINKDQDLPFSIISNNMVLPETEEKSKDLLLTKSVCAALMSLADIRESLYGTYSMESDMKKLKSCCHLQERKLYHSLILQVSERMILKKLRMYSSRSCRQRKRTVGGSLKCIGI